jgi:hypothetical protein
MTHLLNIETQKWILVSGVHKISTQIEVLLLLKIELLQVDPEDMDMKDMILKVILTIQVTNKCFITQFNFYLTANISFSSITNTFQ